MTAADRATQRRRKSVESFARAMFAHLDSGDVAFTKQTACPDAILFDTDEKGAPIEAWGAAEVQAALDGYAEMMQSGAKVSSDIKRIYVRPTRPPASVRSTSIRA